MTYIASVLTRSGTSWGGDELDLTDLEDLDALVDRLRENAGDPILCLVEEDDEYVAIVRVDADGEPRVFVSDRRVLEATGVAARFLADAVEVEPEEPEEAEEVESARPEVEPAGDDALLADLGVAATRLRDLCAEEGMLPSDTIFAIAEAIGAGEELERVRGL